MEEDILFKITEIFIDLCPFEEILDDPFDMLVKIQKRVQAIIEIVEGPISRTTPQKPRADSSGAAGSRGEPFPGDKDD